MMAKIICTCCAKIVSFCKKYSETTVICSKLLVRCNWNSCKQENNTLITLYTNLSSKVHSSIIVEDTLSFYGLHCKGALSCINMMGLLKVILCFINLGSRYSLRKPIEASAGTFHGPTMISPIIPAQIMIPPPLCWHLTHWWWSHPFRTHLLLQISCNYFGYF